MTYKEIAKLIEELSENELIKFLAQISYEKRQLIAKFLSSEI